MGLFSDFDYDEWRERQRVARIRGQISTLEGQVEKYESARQGVEDAKSSCNNEKGEWEGTLGTISSKQIKRSDIFEGEMADRLEEYMEDAKEENTTGINKAGTLISRLESQIEAIDSKITELNSRITSLRNQI